MHETSSLLTLAQCSATLRQLHAGNAGASPPGLQLVCKVWGDRGAEAGAGHWRAQLGLLLLDGRF